uniref:Uncharacterized protein n=1 Tax=Lepeophtheirus salmonis TaxID=72036 RepID=A0A0K2TTE1_LEPSM
MEPSHRLPALRTVSTT